MPRFKSVLKPGPALIYLSAPTRDHLPIFTEPHLAEQAVIQLGRAARDRDAEIAGYCLLPSNIQAIVYFNDEYDLPGFLYHYKWLVSRAIICLDQGQFSENLYRKGKFKPWMNRFEQAAISSLEQFQSRLESLHWAPVKKGLVSNPLEWTYSSAAAWHSGNQGLIEISRDLPRFGLE